VAIYLDTLGEDDLHLKIIDLVKETRNSGAHSCSVTAGCFSAVTRHTYVGRPPRNFAPINLLAND